MLVVRASKILMVAAIAFFASLVAFGNITDYGSNFAFVTHVLSMDTIFPDATIDYRAITNPFLQHAFYILIIAAEPLTAILCRIGSFKLLCHQHARPGNRLKPCCSGALYRRTGCRQSFAFPPNVILHGGEAGDAESAVHKHCAWLCCQSNIKINAYIRIRNCRSSSYRRIHVTTT